MNLIDPQVKNNEQRLKFNQKGRSLQQMQNSPAFHKVSRGNSLVQLSILYNTSVDSLVKLNDIQNPDHIEIGWNLKIR